MQQKMNLFFTKIISIVKLLLVVLQTTLQCILLNLKNYGCTPQTWISWSYFIVFVCTWSNMPSQTQPFAFFNTGLLPLKHPVTVLFFRIFLQYFKPHPCARHLPSPLLILSSTRYLSQKPAAVYPAKYKHISSVCRQLFIDLKRKCCRFLLNGYNITASVTVCNVICTGAQS